MTHEFELNGERILFYYGWNGHDCHQIFEIRYWVSAVTLNSEIECWDFLNQSQRDALTELCYEELKRKTGE
jgi:hypothetical protein